MPRWKPANGAAVQQMHQVGTASLPPQNSPEGDPRDKQEAPLTLTSEASTAPAVHDTDRRAASAQSDTKRHR